MKDKFYFNSTYTTSEATFTVNNAEEYKKIVGVDVPKDCAFPYRIITNVPTKDEDGNVYNSTIAFPINEKPPSLFDFIIYGSKDDE